MTEKLRERRTAASKEVTQTQLPIWPYRQEIINDIQNHQIVIIVGETGSGKTTQVPRFLYNAGFAKRGMIGITQPRRIAAISVAKRVATELRTEAVGLGLVGYAIRFEDVTCLKTRIKFMTDGLLVRDSILDPTLKSYSAIIVDEAHERSLSTDLLLGLMKNILQQRSSLKLVIMSATLNVEQFRSFFPGCAVTYIPGRQFPVTNVYIPYPEEDYLEASLIAVLQIHLDEMQSAGDILVFLPGQEDIEALQALLEEKRSILSRIAKLFRRSTAASSGSLPLHFEKHKKTVDSGDALDSLEASSYGKIEIAIGDRVYTGWSNIKDILVCPIFASLPFEQQAEVFKKTPADSRKIILATNIAETSITIPDVRFVVDCGLTKVRSYNHKTGVEILAVQEISKANANQRSGRAGRDGAGKCFRLYTERSFESLRDQALPEIARCDMSQVYLQLKAMNVRDPKEFHFLDAPPPESLNKAKQFLSRIGALRTDDEITALGNKLLALPMTPLLAKLLLDANEFECTAEMLSITAMLSADAVWYYPRNLTGSRLKAYEFARKKITHPAGDHLTLLNVYLLWDDAIDKVAFCKEYYVNNNAMMRAKKIRDQLKDLLLTSCGMNLISKCKHVDEWDRVRQCLAKGFWLQTARLDPSGQFYRTVINRRPVNLHPSCVLFGKRPPPTWIVYSEYVQTRKPYIRNATAIEHDWLRKLVPQWFMADGESGEGAPFIQA